MTDVSDLVPYFAIMKLKYIKMIRLKNISHLAFQQSYIKAT